jgi:predicted ATPase
LLALVERAGDLVDKRDLIARVWPNVVVEEATLRVHVSALRRVLDRGRTGAQYIKSFPGRGYRFEEPVRIVEREHVAQPAQSCAREENCRLPKQLSRIFGRAEAIHLITERLLQHRFVTLVGAGGIGKTTIAVAAGHSLLSSLADGAQLVDLAPLTDPKLVPGAIASSLGLSALTDDPMRAVLSFLSDRQLLIVLDNCEHLLEASADVAERMLSVAPKLHLIATSREPLRAHGEWIQHIKPLEMPDTLATVTAAEALRFPAVGLFAERASASSDTFKMEDHDIPVVIDICRRLDGNPLAIELAASRVDHFGLQVLATQLDNRFEVLTWGRRTAAPRHRSLRATFDWSFQLLSPRQRIILRRLSVFHDVFDLEAAHKAVADAQINRGAVLEGLADLVAKSLIVVDVARDKTVFKLMETTRAYAAAQLAQCDEQRLITQRHAECYA